MKKYTRRERYRRIEEVGLKYFNQQINKVKTDIEFYPSYHIAPPCGLLNDPNGLAEFNGEHHIFYQFHPIAPTHGLKYWNHITTKDFVHYQNRGIALYPDTDMDSHGVFSGGALLENDKLFLFFTGNKFDANWVRDPSQGIVYMDKNGKFSSKKQIIASDPEFTEHFRDPKPWKQGTKYYLILGCQTQNQQGALVLYSSDSIDENWQKIALIQSAIQIPAYMYECPDYFEIDNKGILIFSPQGVQSTDLYSYQNIDNVVYSIGSLLDLATGYFDGQELIELDKGFDFYAPQTYQDSKGRRILIAWIGLGGVEYPYDEENRWSQMLSIPREITISDGRIIQTPIEELKGLRYQSEIITNSNITLKNSSFECELELKKNFSIKFCNENGDFIIFDAKDDYVLDRSQQGVNVNVEYGTIRKAKRINTSEQRIRIFYDKSTLEIFVDNGQTVFTSRVFIKQLKILIINGLKYGSLHYCKADISNDLIIR